MEPELHTQEASLLRGSVISFEAREGGPLLLGRLAGTAPGRGKYDLPRAGDAANSVQAVGQRESSYGELPQLGSPLGARQMLSICFHTFEAFV